MSINIGKENINDPHYRYKRKIVTIRYSGKGKNTKTAIINLKKIARQLYTTPQYISKFFAHKFATVTGIDTKTKDWFLKGEHTLTNVEDKLEQFIALYVLCTHCNNPETSLAVRKGSVKMFCYACGKKQYIEDYTDKKNVFVKYLAKHPQDNAKMYKAYTRKKQSQDKMIQNAKSKQSDDDDVVWHTDTTDLAVESRKHLLSNVVQFLVKSSDSDLLDDI